MTMKATHGPNPGDTEAPQDRTLEPLLVFRTDEKEGEKNTHTHTLCQTLSLLPEYYSILYKYCTKYYMCFGVAGSAC